MFMETAISSGIEIIVEPSFLPKHSHPAAGIFVFAYQIEIKNRNTFPVQLRKRHWVIVSGTGGIEHVYGDGVVGEFPLLGQNESFVYTSSCQLPTPIGIMEGEYIFENKLTGNTFDATIPRFRMEATVLLN
jgi:ApaG protein